MTNKKKLISIVMLIVTLILSVTLIFGWYTINDDATSLTLKVTKIDSQVYLYQGVDSNNNGIPDLTKRYTEKELEDIQKNYPKSKKEYYTETRAFKYIGMNYALSSDTTTTIDLQYDINLYPTQSETLKFSVFNNSDGVNYISFEFADTTYTDQSQVNLLKCLSVRVGQVKNNTFSTNTPDKTSSDVSISMQNKVYFGSYLTEKKDGISNMGLDIGDVKVEGQMDKNDTLNNDVCDLWFEFTLETYDVIKKQFGADYLSESDYQALSGKSLTLPILKATLELRI